MPPRPALDALPAPPPGPIPGLVLTMRPDEWDDVLAAAYASGATLVELARDPDGSDRLVGLYRRRPPT